MPAGRVKNWKDRQNRKKTTFRYDPQPIKYFEARPIISQDAPIGGAVPFVRENGRTSFCRLAAGFAQGLEARSGSLGPDCEIVAAERLNRFFREGTDASNRA